MITLERLKELLHYNPETGVFTWIKRRRGCKENKVGYIVKGYLTICIDSRACSGHRLAFLYMTGAMPPNYIDHIDGNKSNNAWVNLRAATQSQNQFNASVNTKSKTGLKGAYLQKNSGKYAARTVFNGKRVFLGCFDTAIEAKQAYNNFHLSNKNEFFKA